MPPSFCLWLIDSENALSPSKEQKARALEVLAQKEIEEYQLYGTGTYIPSHLSFLMAVNHISLKHSPRGRGRGGNRGRGRGAPAQGHRGRGGFRGRGTLTGSQRHHPLTSSLDDVDFSSPTKSEDFTTPVKENDEYDSFYEDIDENSVLFATDKPFFPGATCCHYFLTLIMQMKRPHLLFPVLVIQRTLMRSQRKMRPSRSRDWFRVSNSLYPRSRITAASSTANNGPKYRKFDQRFEFGDGFHCFSSFQLLSPK